ncbi:HIT-like protein [Meredithblackwellia eburnea MCA 4105]
MEKTCQPYNILPAPTYKVPGDKSDTFLLALIGVLETLAQTSTNFAYTIKKLDLDEGITKADEACYIEKAGKVCDQLGISVNRGKGTFDPDYVTMASMLNLPVSRTKGLEPLDDRSLKQLKCIFCDHKIRATFKIIQQNEDFIAFLSHNPSSPIHVLCIPTFHVHDLTFLRKKDLPWLEEMGAYAKEAYLKMCKSLGLPQDLEYRSGFHVPPSITVGHLHLHMTALPTADPMVPEFTVAERTHLDYHHTPGKVYDQEDTYDNELQNLVGDGGVDLVAYTGALYILQEEFLDLLRRGKRVEARALKTNFREERVQIVITELKG